MTSPEKHLKLYLESDSDECSFENFEPVDLPLKQRISGTFKKCHQKRNISQSSSIDAPCKKRDLYLESDSDECSFENFEPVDLPLNQRISGTFKKYHQKRNISQSSSIDAPCKKRRKLDIVDVPLKQHISGTFKKCHQKRNSSQSSHIDTPCKKRRKLDDVVDVSSDLNEVTKQSQKAKVSRQANKKNPEMNIFTTDIRQAEFTPVYLDTETSGLSVNRHELLQIAAVCQSSEFMKYITPPRGHIVDVSATKVNGMVINKYDNSLIVNGCRVETCSPKQAMIALIQFLSNIDNPIIICHRAVFDLRFIFKTLANCHLLEVFLAVAPSFICSLRLLRKLLPNESRHTLRHLAEVHFNYIDKSNHCALTDARILALFDGVISSHLKTFVQSMDSIQ